MSNYILFWLLYLFATCSMLMVALNLFSGKRMRLVLLIIFTIAIVPVQVRPEDLINQDIWYVPTIVQSIGVAFLGRGSDAFSYLQPIFNLIIGVFCIYLLYSITRFFRWRKRQKIANNSSQ